MNVCEDGSLFHFHTKTTERIEMKFYSKLAYTLMGIKHKLQVVSSNIKLRSVK